MSSQRSKEEHRTLLGCGGYRALWTRPREGVDGHLGFLGYLVDKSAKRSKGTKKGTEGAYETGVGSAGRRFTLPTDSEAMESHSDSPVSEAWDLFKARSNLSESVSVVVGESCIFSEQKVVPSTGR